MAGLNIFQAAPTAASALAPDTSAMPTCVSDSGGDNKTRASRDSSDQPVGAVNVAPCGVALGVSAASPCATGLDESSGAGTERLEEFSETQADNHSQTGSIAATRTSRRMGPSRPD